MEYKENEGVAMKRIAIVGSRDFKNLHRVIAYVDSLPETTIVVSGGARGVDTVAEQVANRRGLQTHIFYAQWKRYGKSAGMRRNREMIDTVDEVVAFWDGQSRGTEQAIAYAKANNIPVKVIVG